MDLADCRVLEPRLILAHMGKLSASNQSILNDPAVALGRKLEWFPDSLGNWSGVDEVNNLADKGLTRTDKTPGQDPITTEIRHEVDAFNRIEAVTTDSQPVAHVNDPAGNLVFDGTYVYQYDAWNRLVEVNLAGTLTTADFTSDGKIDQTTGHEIGDLVVRFQYDALGRLIMAQKVHSGGPPAPVYRTEHYYYDGVRRIQTVDDNATPANTADDLTQHEYVYGPEYVDEFVLQSYRDNGVQQPLYMLQDANYNVMALLDDTGAVVEQYQWEPYGSLATLDTTASPRPDNAVGHQGLFFYRFDTGDTLSLNALGLYYNRNRWYSPSLGRFTSRDPNETALRTQRDAVFEGSGFFVDGGGLDPQAHYADGMNLMACERSNPLVHLDPMGFTSAHHFYALYLGGASRGPGLMLTDAQHSRFHKALNEMVGAGYGQEARDIWAKMSHTDRKNALTVAASMAGVDTSDSSFKSLLNDSIAEAKVGRPGTDYSQPRKAPRVRTVKMQPGANSLTYKPGQSMFSGRIVKRGSQLADLADRASRGIAIAGAAMVGIHLQGMISDPALHEIAAISQRVRRTGQMTIMDEVSVLDDLLQVTGNSVAAAYGWNHWRETMGY